MSAVTRASRAVAAPAPARRPASVAKVFDWVLAALAHVAVAASWALTAASVMGSLAIGRRMLLNSEWAFDTGRLPQPWMIAVGVVAILIAHRLFHWTMARYTRGVAAYGPSVVAWAGVLAGVAYGAYVWQPPVMVGKKVGPASGESTSWNLVSYAAYYARYWLPGLVALVTGVLVLASRQSPWRAFLAGRRRVRLARQPRRANAATTS
jgi:hypothetical protein